MNPTKIVRVKRTGPETAILEIERYLKEPGVDSNMEYVWDDGSDSEKYVFFLNIQELYSLTKEILGAASEKIEIKKPGTY